MAAVLIIFLLINLSIRCCRAHNELELVSRSCETATVKSKDDYLKNYALILQRMEPEMYRNKFALHEGGKPPEKLHVFSQCTSELSSVACARCFARISKILQACFPTTGGRVYLEGCFIRANNYSFYKEVTSDADSKKCGVDVETSEDFNKVLKKTMSKMVHKAPKSKGLVLFKESSNGNGTTVYGMAQCWKILDKNMCSSCLRKAVDLVYRCLPAKEGRALKAGCSLRYSTSNFADFTHVTAVEYALVSFLIYVLITAIVCSLAVAVGMRLGKMAHKQMNPRREWKDSNSTPKIVSDYDLDALSKLVHKFCFMLQDTGKEVDFAALDGAMKFLQFKFSTLEKATGCFNETNKLGSGGYGEVFKGELPGGREIAVKRLFVNGRSRNREIYNELEIISKAQHKNLVRCLGGCFTIIESFLVYEFLANKSLDCILFDPEKKKELDWARRHKIIMGTGEGLEYLHQGCEVRVIHRDIKASNILLDHRFRPKIADFGLARLCPRDTDKIHLVKNTVAGTSGYMAPEYITKGLLTEKIDVYSFGVVMLEIISGVKNTKIESDYCFDTLIADAWKHFQSNTTTEIIDESLRLEDQVEEIKREIHLALLCTQAEPSLRPNMSKVLQILRHKDMEMPSPTKPPFLYESLHLSSCSFHSFRTKSQVSEESFPGKSQTNDNLQSLDHQDHCNL